MNPLTEPLKRKGFLVWAGVELILALLSLIVIHLYDTRHSGTYPIWFKILVGAMWLPLYILIIFRRSQDTQIGRFSPLMIIVGFVPIAAFALWGYLFFAPSKNR